MGKFLIKRFGISIIIMFFVMLLFYSILRCMPGSYVENKARELTASQGKKSYEEWVEQLNESYGLNVSIPKGYIAWLGNMLKGDFGNSWQWNVPVTRKFQEVIGYSAALGISAFLLQIMIAIPLGILAARKPYSMADYAVNFFALIGSSLPVFFFAALLKMIFSVKLGWTELYGIAGRMHEQLSPFGQFMDYAKHMILPIITLTIISVGNLMRYTRTNMLEAMHSDYIRTARAKGVSEGRVTYHAFRNTLIPLITILGRSFPGLFAGAMITEQLFQIPGIGYTAYLSMIRGDIPFSMFYLTFLALLTLFGNLMADILYAVADPRVRFCRKGEKE